MFMCDDSACESLAQFNLIIGHQNLNILIFVSKIFEQCFDISKRDGTNSMYQSLVDDLNNEYNSAL